MLDKKTISEAEKNVRRYLEQGKLKRAKEFLFETSRFVFVQSLYFSS